MALAAEVVFYNAVVAAEGIRQASRAAALTTYAFNPANAVAYVTALSDADAVYVTAVKAASDTSNLMTGTVGHSSVVDFGINRQVKESTTMIALNFAPPPVAHDAATQLAQVYLGGRRGCNN